MFYFYPDSGWARSWTGSWELLVWFSESSSAQWRQWNKIEHLCTTHIDEYICLLTILWSLGLVQSALTAGCWVLYFHKRVSAGKARRNIFGRLAFYSVIIVIGAIGGPDKIYLFSCLFVCDHCNCCNQGFVFPQTRLGREARRPGNLRFTLSSEFRTVVRCLG